MGALGSSSFQLLTEEVAVAAQYRVPFVLDMLNNTNHGLIRNAERGGYEMQFGIDLASGENDLGVDRVKAMPALGGDGRAVARPQDLQGAFAWVVETANGIQAPVLVEVRIEMGNLVAMGPSLDEITGSHPLPEAPVAATVR